MRGRRGPHAGLRAGRGGAPAPEGGPRTGCASEPTARTPSAPGWESPRSDELWGIRLTPRVPELPGDSWQRCARPEQAGWSAAKLKLARELSEEQGSTAVMIVQHGRIVDARGPLDEEIVVQSVRKAFLGGLIGAFMEEAQLDLDDVLPCLTVDEKHATIRHLVQARFGWQGRWGEWELVPATCVRMSTTAWFALERPDPDDGFGYTCWVDSARGSFAARGGMGHEIRVFPSLDLVLVHRVPNPPPVDGPDWEDVARLWELVLEAR